jgi:hypothetical protein
MTFIRGRNYVSFAVRGAEVKINPLADYSNPRSHNCYSTIADCSYCEWGRGRHARCGRNAVPLHTESSIKHTITMAEFDSPPGNSELFFSRSTLTAGQVPQIAVGVTLKV